MKYSSFFHTIDQTCLDRPSWTPRFKLSTYFLVCFPKCPSFNTIKSYATKVASHYMYEFVSTCVCCNKIKPLKRATLMYLDFLDYISNTTETYWRPVRVSFLHISMKSRVGICWVEVWICFCRFRTLARLLCLAMLKNCSDVPDILRSVTGRYLVLRFNTRKHRLRIYLIRLLSCFKCWIFRLKTKHMAEQFVVV